MHSSARASSRAIHLKSFFLEIPHLPFLGYEIDESMYVMFRSLVLTGVILVAGLSAAGKIIDYIGGADMVEIRLDWVVTYMIPMVTICTFMAHSILSK